MRYIFPITRIVAGIAVLLGVIFVSHSVAERFGHGNGAVTTDSGNTTLKSKSDKRLVIEGESINALAGKLREALSQAEYAPGERSFTKACELLAGGFHFEAEQKLKQLNANYPYAPSVFEARRILGEMNMDNFFSELKAGGKFLYKVKSGDSYFKIAREQESSLSNLMVVNNLFSLDDLRRGEELLVMPLHCNLVIDIPNKRLTLEYGKEFLKDYPFKKLVSTAGSGTKKTLVSSVGALLDDDRAVNATSDKFRNAHKVIEIDRPQLEIVGEDFEVDDAFSGIILEREQIEELAILLREGNLVEIRY